MSLNRGAYRSVLAPGLFEGQTVIVTGGGSGFGRCMAHELASLGARVVIVGRTLEKLETVVGEIVDDGGCADCWTCDIRDEERVAQVVAEIVARHGAIHGLVNNAGGQFPSPLVDISRNGFEAVVRTNLVGGFLVSREVFRQSMRDHGGAIVNITADCSNGFPLMGHSGAARAGMENLTRTAAWEWGPFGVRVNAVAPGFVVSSGFDSYDDPEVQAKLRQSAGAIPVKRYGTESEVSALVCFLLSPAAGFINGDTVHMDGGARFGSSATYAPLPAEPRHRSQGFNGFHRSVQPGVLAQPPED
jgi:citronellol/citronellal dehydrogenase